MSIEPSFWECVCQAGLTAKLMNEAPTDWDEVVANVNYAPVSYTRSMGTYQAAYMVSAAQMSLKAGSHHNLSMVLYHDLRPVGVWPLSIRLSEEAWICGSNESAVRAPLFVRNLSEKSQKVLIGRCLDVLDGLCLQTGQAVWKGVESVSTNGVDLWYRAIRERGASAKMAHELYVDLSLGLPTIKANLRRRYKSLVAKGSRLWQSSVLDRVRPNLFTEFRELHHRVAGRVTRSKDTWNLQEEAINKGDAFLVVLRDSNGVMVGGGLFHISWCEGLYAVGVYDRSLFELPLGHVVQMKAIEHMKSLGLRWYKIGDRPYPGDNCKPTEKELSIAHFKEGFSTHMFLQLHTSCPVRAPDPCGPCHTTHPPKIVGERRH